MIYIPTQDIIESGLLRNRFVTVESVKGARKIIITAAKKKKEKIEFIKKKVKVA